MKQLGLKYFTDTDITILGLLLFFSVFIGVCLWTYRRNSSQLYNHMEQLPLKDGE